MCLLVSTAYYHWPIRRRDHCHQHPPSSLLVLSIAIPVAYSTSGRNARFRQRLRLEGTKDRTPDARPVSNPRIDTTPIVPSNPRNTPNPASPSYHRPPPHWATHLNHALPPPLQIPQNQTTPRPRNPSPSAPTPTPRHPAHTSPPTIPVNSARRQRGGTNLEARTPRLPLRAPELDFRALEIG